MRKRCWLVVLCVLALCILTACKHTHDYGGWKTEKKATCAREGLKVRKCECGDEDEKEIPKLDHQFGEWVVKTEATYEAEGVKERVCSECGQKEEEKLPKSDHKFGMWTINTEATCQSEGVRERTCELCGETEQNTLMKTAHTYGQWTVQTSATCKTDGVQTRSCSVCGATEESTLPKGAHTYKAASGSGSCQTSGTVTYTCTVCGDTKTETGTAKTYTATEIYDMYRDSVGEIITYDKRGSELALGSCFVQSSDGRLITNYHVIEGAYSAKVTVGGKTYTIEKVLAYDPEIDAAILKISASGLKPVTLCSLSHKVGEVVYAFGSSKGLTATFSDGIITHDKRESGGVIYVQHSAPISSGNSGGPLINSYGEVIGINTMTLQDSQNLNFAVCASELDNLDYSKSLSMSEFYNTASNAFTKLANYIMSKSTLSDGSYTWVMGTQYSSDYSDKYLYAAMYYPDDGEIVLALSIDSEYYLFISLDETLSGSYQWAYSDDDDYKMVGTLYGSSFASGSKLTYTNHNISNTTLRTSVRDLASSMATLLCLKLDGYLSSAGITAEDLGFLHF